MSDTKLFGGMIVGLILLMVVLVFAIIEDAKQWAAYREANHCREAGYIAGHTSVGTGITSSGKVGTITTHVPRKTRWLCDNNVEIFR